jgi:hypothetical protein
VTCKYEKCWENNIFNSKSQYCHLHQKILRNICTDKFALIATSSSDDKWESLIDHLARKDFTMKIHQLDSLLKNTLKIEFSYKEKEALFETFKVK